MDWSYIHTIALNDLKEKHPKVNEKILDELYYLLIPRFGWRPLLGKELLIIGLLESRYDYYYITVDTEFNIGVISCACNVLDLKYNEVYPLSLTSKDYEKIKANLEQYLKDNPNDKLLECCVDDNISFKKIIEDENE